MGKVYHQRATAISSDSRPFARSRLRGLARYPRSSTETCPANCWTMAGSFPLVSTEFTILQKQSKNSDGGQSTHSNVQLSLYHKERTTGVYLPMKSVREDIIRSLRGCTHCEQQASQFFRPEAFTPVPSHVIHSRIEKLAISLSDWL
jgi:hypothetical protein